MATAAQLKKATGLDVYAPSVTKAGKATYFLGRRRLDKFVGCCGQPCLPDVKQAGEIDGQCVCVGPLSHANAAAIRERVAWTAPKCLGLATSIGLGDRLGLATPGHIRAVRGTVLAVVLAQQSIREMTRTQRTPDEVMDAATWGVLQEGFRDGFGADADHLQKLEDIDVTAKAGFTMFTIDPGAHVDNAADTDDFGTLAEKAAGLDWDTLGVREADLVGRYIGQGFLLHTCELFFDEPTFFRAAAKYGQAVVHTIKMYRHLLEVCQRPFELEISVDETDSPTSPAEHFFFANELKHAGVKWVSLAPRFPGRFEKGVDYIGDLDSFRIVFEQHVAVMKALGPYKMSIHSGSDKFTIYPLVAELAGLYVHLKTAGTSYLEAVRAIAGIDPGLFREILEFAHDRYQTDKASYHVSADPAKVPHAAAVADKDLAGVLDLFDGRQLLHVTFGSVLTARNADNTSRFRDRILTALKQDEDKHYEILEMHLGRHVAPFVRQGKP